MTDTRCELCLVEERFNFHHFIPRTLHRNKWFKKRFSRNDMITGMHVCRQCHRMLHATIPEKELGRHYHSRELLLSHAAISKYVEWKRRRRRAPGAGS